MEASTMVCIGPLWSALSERLLGALLGFLCTAQRRTERAACHLFCLFDEELRAGLFQNLGESAIMVANGTTPTKKFLDGRRFLLAQLDTSLSFS